MDEVSVWLYGAVDGMGGYYPRGREFDPSFAILMVFDVFFVGE